MVELKYAELIAFEPIDSVKVLTEADSEDLARRDVSTFVISPQMRRMLVEQLLPHLRLDGSVDTKGVLVVANYGTGKTHLMSTISSVLEHADLAADLRDEEVRKAIQGVAGNFQVMRAEIGATKMGLRDIVCGELESGLKRLGVEFAFPPLEQVSNTKDSLVDMMAAFEKVEPDRGLLFVLDELLDYLRGRRDAELIVDLAFLREIGEISRSTRFRFIAGIQEALFDNPRFASASDAIRRVRDRFEQVRISREDVAYVVQERLLRKDAAQKAQIRQQLERFTPAFDGMAERLEEFVALYPVHPSYLRTFERVTLVEKRRVLTTLSHAMAELLDTDVPTDVPGLVCYDGYRSELDNDPSNRSIPDVALVLDRAQVLRSKLESALPQKEDIPVALRIVDALAVHRLTTEDIDVPIGLTVDELRDDLCLIPEGVPELDAGFIGATLESVVAEIVKAVSGQFLSRNDDNGQLFLDVRKDIDYDQLIQERADSLDDQRLDDVYFRALEEVLEQRDAPYVASYRIWSYELPWKAKNVTRMGYLFMGAPNERSTAQPPRDFYIYFLQPYEEPAFADQELSDETFVRLASPDEEFTTALRRYAGADALTARSTEQHRLVYEQKRQQALQTMVVWLRQNMANAMTVTYRGETKPLGTWLQQIPGAKTSVKAQIDAIAARALEPHFEERYPGYPAFSAEITKQSFDGTVQAAISQVATRRSTALGTKVLTSLGLADMKGQIVTDGEFAKAVLIALEGSGGKAVNRSELLTERDPGVLTWAPWHLEPSWLVVVAAALCHAGRLELGYPAGQVDALGLDRLTKMSSEELVQLTHIAPPKALPIVALREAADLLDIAPGAIPDSGATDVVVQQILEKTQIYLNRVLEAEQQVSDGVLVWGAHAIDHQQERRGRVAELRKVLEDLKGRDSVGKMNKLAIESKELEAAHRGKQELERTEGIVKARNHLSALQYLTDAQAAFDQGDPFVDEASELRSEVLELFAGDKVDPAAASVAKSKAEKLKARYREEAEHAHQRDRLDSAGENHKKAILDSGTFKDLAALASLELLPSGTFGAMQQHLAAIGTCLEFTSDSLAEAVRCPHCGYLPRPSAGPTAKAQVEELDEGLRKLRANWAAALHDSIKPPEIAQGIPLVKSGRAELEAFASSGDLPSPVPKPLVNALQEVLRGFTVRNVSADDVYSALFPDNSPVPLSSFEERFQGFAAKLRGDADPSKIRVLPAAPEQ
ncbi:MAG: DUF6079 family protein [Gaiellaceae bacterium]